MNFGDAGCLNDINTLSRSPVINYLNRGVFQDYNYFLNAESQYGAYMFLDGIYPNWSCFGKTIAEPRNSMEAYYAKTQESVRKDIERCYVLLQKRFSIVKNPAMCWYIKTMKLIMTAC
jgi:hypothetical protein